MSDFQRIGKILYEDRSCHALYLHGYDCALSFTYMPDFANSGEKEAWLSGFRAGISEKNNNPCQPDGRPKEII